MYSINGIPACANKKLLTDILKTEWGFTGNNGLPFIIIMTLILFFKGYVVSDRGALGMCNIEN